MPISESWWTFASGPDASSSRSTSTQWIAPGAITNGSQDARQPAPAQQAPTAAPQPARQAVTYRFDWLPGKNQQGYIGTDGSMFGADWSKVA